MSSFDLLRFFFERRFTHIWGVYIPTDVAPLPKHLTSVLGTNLGHDSWMGSEPRIIYLFLFIYWTNCRIYNLCFGCVGRHFGRIILSIVLPKMSGNSASNQTRQSKNDGDYKTVLSMQDIASLLRYCQYWAPWHRTVARKFPVMVRQETRAVASKTARCRKQLE